MTDVHQFVGILRDMGCEMVQGYYFSKPVSAARMTELLYQQPHWYEK